MFVTGVCVNNINSVTNPQIKIKNFQKDITSSIVSSLKFRNYLFVRQSMVKERWYRHPVGFGRKGLSQLFEGFFKVRSPGWVGVGKVRMFQSNNYILLAAPPRVRNGHKH